MIKEFKSKNELLKEKLIYTINLASNILLKNDFDLDDELVSDLEINKVNEIIENLKTIDTTTNVEIPF